MRKRIMSALAALLIMLGSAAGSILFTETSLHADEASDSKEKETELKQKIKTAQEQQAELKKKIEKAKAGIENAEDEKEYLDSLVTTTQTEIDATRELIDEYNVKIEQKSSEIAEMEASIDEKFDQTMGRLRFSYEEGTASYLELILESDSLPDFLSSVDRVGSMMDFDRSLMLELSAKLKVLEDEKTVLENTQKEQVELEKSLNEKVDSLEEQIKEADAYIVQLRANEETYAKEYEKAKAAEKEANTAIEKLLAERQRATNTPYWGGEFIWPVPARYNRISSGYGWRYIFGRSDFHLGIDIPGAYGTPIYASNGGTVIVATYHYSYGNYVVIDHGGGYSTLYGHNSSLCVRVGDRVEQGDVIAKMGSTGSSTGNHCHFEVRINGKTQQPLNYVRQP